VTVLDVSGSMVGMKLALLKQAMGFVIGNLGPRDRLCIISFSSGSLAAGGGTNIREALRRAARMSAGTGTPSPVVVLLSDGQDTYTVPGQWGHDANYDALVPPFACTSTGRGTAPVHTLRLGTDHDAAAMHTVAEATGRTFSFVEDEADMQDAFAQCIGGLLSVVVQGLRVDVACASRWSGLAGTRAAWASTVAPRPSTSASSTRTWSGGSSYSCTCRGPAPPGTKTPSCAWLR
jgi:uncharacterized protein YegL